MRKPRIASHVLALAAMIAALPPGAAAAAGWTGGGNEPSWRVEVSPEAITFSTPDGERRVIEPPPDPKRAQGVEVYFSAGEADSFTLVATDAICNDPMSGMPHPKTLVLVTDQVFLGCGGDPLTLLLGDWRVAEVDGEPVIADAEASLGFEPDGSLHGSASCNRFFGTFDLTGEALTLSPAGTTRMACEDGVMAQEQRFLAALREVRRFELSPRGELWLLNDDGSAVIRSEPHQ